jgi:lysophospholipase L1-like esterase
MNTKTATTLGLIVILNSVASPMTAEANSPTAKSKIVLVGDSTVADRTGWGLGFLALLDTNKAECINAARGGRSSMNCLREGLWTNALALKGDYYLIQFGHNNQPGKPGRSTDMAAFIANLKQYMDDTRAIGATPVLVTSLPRRLGQLAQSHNELTARCSEYQSTGPGANPAARVKWAKQLTDEEARAITVEKVLGGADGWRL